MSAAGVVCLQEFAQYDDWRIEKNIELILKRIDELPPAEQLARERRSPFDAYTLYYVAQALYQVNGPAWQKGYPRLRDAVVSSQIREPDQPERDGMWNAHGQVGGRPGELYQTAVSCFVLSIPEPLPAHSPGREN